MAWHNLKHEMLKTHCRYGEICLLLHWSYKDFGPCYAVKMFIIGWWQGMVKEREQRATKVSAHTWTGNFAITPKPPGNPIDTAFNMNTFYSVRPLFQLFMRFEAKCSKILNIWQFLIFYCVLYQLSAVAVTKRLGMFFLTKNLKS